ncbi:MAG: hypothetical protein ABW122_04715 [Ilumatobacteraceae bacterium]
MADIVDPSRLLEVLGGFRPLRRVLLGTAGTLQGTLSAYFGAPVTIEVIDQRVDGDVMHRTVDLVCVPRDIVACRADTAITVDDDGLRDLIVEQRLGLGQIVAFVGVRTLFELDAAAQEADEFWRTYRLSGVGFQFVITERFPEHLYPDVPEPA